jgi:hypothetical protein
MAAAIYLLAGLHDAAAEGPCCDSNLLSRAAGLWRVITVELKPAPLQALGPNDPADLGAILEISPNRLSWRPGKGDAFSDVCEAPQLTCDGEISCAKGFFGYPGATLKIINSRIRLEWYDNAILTLDRFN